MVRSEEQAPATLTSGRPSLGAFAAPPSDDGVHRERVLPVSDATASDRDVSATATRSERLANVGVALALVALLALGIAGAFAFTQRGPRVVLVAEPPEPVDAGAATDAVDAAEATPPR